SFLSGDDTAPRPLIAQMFTRIRNRHDHAVAVDYSSPHVKAESTIVGLLCLSKHHSQSFTGWKAVFRHQKPLAAPAQIAGASLTSETSYLQCKSKQSCS